MSIYVRHILFVVGIVKQKKEQRNIQSGRQPPQHLFGEIKAFQENKYTEDYFGTYDCYNMKESNGERFWVPCTEIHDPHGQWSVVKK
mmetsp:Transcript_6270/g.9500  ORF Transcript_6270/g.9500 Transcript_6270/m.9500 type:complete len:87 (-) Transcript_6270:66-326(-)